MHPLDEEAALARLLRAALQPDRAATPALGAWERLRARLAAAGAPAAPPDPPGLRARRTQKERKTK